MESIVAKLLDDFERGRMTRRQLIQSIAVVAAAAAGATSAAGAKPIVGGVSVAGAVPVAGAVSAAGADSVARTISFAAQSSKAFKAVAVNHISYQVNDYAKTRDFYADLFGMKVVKDTGKQCNLVFGDTDTFLLPRNAPAGATPPRIDHVAYTIEAWNKDEVKAELERRGLQPTPDTDDSFHVKDPNGFDLQISGVKMKPY